MGNGYASSQVDEEASVTPNEALSVQQYPQLIEFLLNYLQEKSLLVGSVFYNEAHVKEQAKSVQHFREYTSSCNVHITKKILNLQELKFHFTNWYISFQLERYDFYVGTFRFTGTVNGVQVQICTYARREREFALLEKGFASLALKQVLYNDHTIQIVTTKEQLGDKLRLQLTELGAELDELEISRLKRLDTAEKSSPSQQISLRVKVFHPFIYEDSRQYLLPSKYVIDSFSPPLYLKTESKNKKLPIKAIKGRANRGYLSRNLVVSADKANCWQTNLGLYQLTPMKQMKEGVTMREHFEQRIFREVNLTSQTDALPMFASLKGTGITSQRKVQFKASNVQLSHWHHKVKLAKVSLKIIPFQDKFDFGGVKIEGQFTYELQLGEFKLWHRSNTPVNVNTKLGRLYHEKEARISALLAGLNLLPTSMPNSKSVIKIWKRMSKEGYIRDVEWDIKQHTVHGSLVMDEKEAAVFSMDLMTLRTEVKIQKVILSFAPKPQLALVGIQQFVDVLVVLK